MRETKITAFLLGATILSSMGLSVPAFATSTNSIVDWIFDEVNTGQSTKYNMSATEKNQVIQEGTTWEVMDGYPINIPSKTITVDGNTASGQAIDGETIKGSIVYLNSGDTLGTLVVKNVGDMKVPSGIDPSNTEAIANYYSNPDNYNATNIGGYIQNLTDYLKNDNTIKDSSGADLDVSGVPAVRTENTNLTVQNNIFYNSSTVGASDSTTKDFGAGIVADNELAQTATMNISQNTFIDNAAQGAGAAVNVEGNSNLNLTNNIFIRNSATGTSQNVGELIGHGGAVDFSGKVMTSSNNKFYQNTADESGGAIYIHGNTTVTSTNDTFVSNTTKQTNGGAILNTGNLTVQNGVFETNISKGSGGAIANDFVVTNFAGTEPTVVDYGSLTVSNSTFKGNRATDDNQNTTVVGGAILNVSTANLTSNTYTDNVADFGGAIGSEVSLAKEADGKIYDPPKVVLTSKNERFIGNKARQGGGAIFNAGDGIELSDGEIHFVSAEANLENVFMQDNIGGYEGGAIYNTGKMTITGGTIDSNKTDDDTRGSGGAIRNNVVGYRETQTGPVVGFVTGDLTVKDVTISNNISQLAGGGVQNTGTFKSSGNTYEGNSSKAGGAIYNETSSISNIGSGVTVPTGTLTSTNDTFKNNVASQTGGAIYNGTKAEVVIEGASFQGNQAAQGGGAIYNFGKVTVGEDSSTTFKDNKATAGQGGAIYNNANAETIVGGASFQNNQADQSGGAIYNSGKLTINNASTTSFTGNKSINAKGGAIYNGENAEAIVGGASFQGNQSLQGGAIYNNGKLNVANASTSTFKDNTAGTGQGGAIYNDAKGVATIEKALFQNNQAAQSGGAIYNSGKLTINNASTTSFTGNKSINAKGGAIYNGENAEAIVGGASFQGNQSLQGGAIYNNGKLSVANASTSTFKDNTAGTGKGGAIYNDAKGVATIEKALFQNNQAAQGGAIYNSGKLTINNASTTAFKDNKATGGKGAAIYNASNGTVIIQGADDQIDLSYDPYLNQTDLNTGNPLPNPQRRLFGDNQDVYNEANATLTIQDSKLQLHHSKDLTKGVININKSKTGTVNINNSQIDVGKAAVYGDTINVNKGSEMLVHLNTKDGEKGDLGKNFGGLSANTISVSDDDTAITIRVKAGEHMDKEDGPKEFKILDAETLNVVDNTGFATITKNHMYDIKYKGDGVYELTKVRPICPNGGCVHNAWVESEGEMDGHTKAQQIRELLNDLAQKYGCESKLYRDALDGIAPDVSPLIQAQATEVTQRLHGIISKQLYASMDRTGYVHRGKRFYRFPERKSRVWIQGVYGQSEYSGDKGFDMDTEGIALGFDKHIGKDTKLGLAYTYSKSTGTAVQRDTDVEAHTVAVYGEYNPDRFYSNWLTLYSRSSYEENKKVYTERVKAEYDVDVFGGQIMFGNKMGPFVVGDWASGVLSPEIGLRYTYIKQHGYTDSAGQKVSDADGHVLTGILGAQYTIGYTLTPSIAWYPELRAAITYDFLEPDLENSVTLVNGSRYDVVTENLDKFGIEIGARVGLDINRKAEIALEYEGVFKGDYTNHTGLASLKYKF